MEPDEKIIITIKRTEDGTAVSIAVNGFSPNEFREAIFDTITAFTNDFDKKSEEKVKTETEKQS